MGGGNRLRKSGQQSLAGLSPRGRGKLRPFLQPRYRLWSIPAWAGETTAPTAHPGQPAVYPRVGGGNYISKAVACTADGLSPRGRGKPNPADVGGGLGGSIPAWAGETLGCPDGIGLRQVYPRVGGGNLQGQMALAFPFGLSPRGRGKPSWHSNSSSSSGSIPAWAGETKSSRPTWILFRVYPRVGGGNFFRIVNTFFNHGLSPRGRGKPPSAAVPLPAAWSIPAWAGETGVDRLAECHFPVYPRVGGGNAAIAILRPLGVGLSPRGRGKPAADRPVRHFRRSIPAWAGETEDDPIDLLSQEVYPRVGGGNWRAWYQGNYGTGLSPRGRGKHGRSADWRPGRGSIPAWAGETGVEETIYPRGTVYPRVGGGNLYGG